MSFSNLIPKKSKRNSIYPRLSSRLFANLVDLTIIALLLMTPLTSILNHIIYGGPDVMSLIPNYENLPNIVKNLSPEEKKVLAFNLFHDFIHNHGLKFLLNQFLQISFILTLGFVSWYYFGTTPGKYILNLKIVDDVTLEKPSTKKLIMRAIYSILLFLTMGLGYFILIFSKKKQALHDKLSGTMIINDKKSNLHTPKA